MRGDKEEGQNESILTIANIDPILDFILLFITVSTINLLSHLAIPIVCFQGKFLSQKHPRPPHNLLFHLAIQLACIQGMQVSTRCGDSRTRSRILFPFLENLLATSKLLPKEHESEGVWMA